MKKTRYILNIKWYTLIISLILSFSLLGNSTVFAVLEQDPQVFQKQTDYSVSQDLRFSDQVIADYTQHLDIIPEAIDPSDYKKAGHLYRLTDRENDLNTLVFRNNDGSNTMYYYTEAVKYVDEEGVLRDKRNAISNDVDEKYASNYKYCNTDNDVRIFFPKSLNDETGIVLDYEDVHIEQLPVTITAPYNSNTAQKIKNTGNPSTGKESVGYARVFGPGTEIRYSPTFSGFKEDIILQYYDGINEFSFTLRTNGLKLEEFDGLYCLVNPKSGSPVVSIGDIIVDDSKTEKILDDEEYYHHYEIKTIRQNEEYVITVVVDPSYLTDDETVFPVTIDPSFEITSVNSGILDISVDTSGTTYKGSALSAGWSIAHQKSFRTFLKFPGMLNSWQWAALAPYGFGTDTIPEITNITLQLYNVAIDWDSTYIDAYQYDGTYAANWSYTTNGTSPSSFSTANYNAKGEFASSTVIDCNAGWKNIDLTAISAYTLSKGIVLQNRHESANYDYVFKQFHSTRNASNKPRITVTWSDSSNNTFQTAKTVNLNTDYVVHLLSSGTLHYYKFTPSATCTYRIMSSDIRSGDPKGWLYDSDYSLLAYNDDGGGNGNFLITYQLEAGEDYYIAAGCYNNGIGSYNVSVHAYVATVNNYYDHGYHVYNNETEAQTKAFINNTMDAVSERYLELFNLIITCNSATYYASITDTCKGTVTTANINTLCSHTNSAHTNRMPLLTDFNSHITGSNVITNALWSNNRIISENTGDENRSCSYGTNIFILTRCSSTYRVNKTQSTLMHELNHQYGAHDHYHEVINGVCKNKDTCSTCGTYPRPSTCIMNTTNRSITEEDIICTACRNEILAHLEDHHS